MSVPLVGRREALAALAGALTAADGAARGLYLVSGDTGAGKTTLVDTALATTGHPILRGGCRPGPPMPLAPLLMAFAIDPQACDPAAEAWRRWADACHAGPAVLFLDDLQWSDTATVDWLHELNELADPPGVVIGAHRSEALPRRHPLRAVRAVLRRRPDALARLIHLGPLALDESRQLISAVIGAQVPPDVAETLHRRATGLPLYLRELAAALPRGWEDRVDHVAEHVLPESLSDLVVQRLSSLSTSAQALAEIAAAGRALLRIDVLAALAPDAGGMDELFDAGLLIELPSLDRYGPDVAFTHDLLAEAIEALTPPMRRRAHHAALARALADRGAPAGLVADHWRLAGDRTAAVPLYFTAAEEACATHAYRDAKTAISTALDLLRPGDVDDRIVLLDRLGALAERCGDTADAVAAWNQVADSHRQHGRDDALGEVQRRIATVHELRNDWTQAVAARVAAGTAFERALRPVDAADQRLLAAAHLQSAGALSAAAHLIRQARADVDAAGQEVEPSTALMATALDGVVRTKQGDGAGVELTRAALDHALHQRDNPTLIAEILYLHADALECASDYHGALTAMSDGVEFCRSRGLVDDATVCLACLTPALRHTGQWDRAMALGGEVIDAPEAPDVARMVAAGEVGLILAARGAAREARPHLLAAWTFGRGVELFGLEIETAWGLSRSDALEGQDDAATIRLRELVDRCAAREERHYSIAAIRWASTFFAERGDPGGLGACTDVLATAAATIGTAETGAALAHALGERALMDGNARRAADQFLRSVELLEGTPVPHEIAETRLRAGVALARADDVGRAVTVLTAAYTTAHQLRARPLEDAAATQLAALGVQMARRRRRHDGVADGDVLTPREREVLALVARGHTNRQIGDALFLSTRTVDMHVRNVLAKLGCRTRTEAAAKAVGSLA